MTYTQNYQLPQWVKSDRILMDDFNDANAKVDAALKSHDDSLASHAAQLENFGNCRVVTGTYTGTGSHGSAAPSTLAFDREPVFLFIRCESYGDGAMMYAIMNRPSTLFFPVPGVNNYSNTVAWSENAVSWYASSAAHQLNESGRVYAYMALLQMDAE